MVLVVCNDFWLNMCHEANKRKIPLFLVGTTCRPEQVFFKKWAGAFRQELRAFQAFFVRDVCSAQLLRSIGCNNIEVVGGLRYDGVQRAAQQAADFPVLSVLKKRGGY